MTQKSHPFLLFFLKIFLTLGMTREELRAAMQAKGILEASGSRDLLWVQAFAAFQADTKKKLNLGCGSCYNEVRRWLKA